MDADSITALRLLETIGKCSANQIEFSLMLDKNPEVLSSINEFECRTFPASGTMLSLYLDAELKSGKAISFQLELDWDEREWIVYTQIEMNDEDGAKPFKEFPDRRTEIFSELLTHLLEAEAELHDQLHFVVVIHVSLVDNCSS